MKRHKMYMRGPGPMMHRMQSGPHHSRRLCLELAVRVFEARPGGEASGKEISGGIVEMAKAFEDYVGVPPSPPAVDAG